MIDLGGHRRPARTAAPTARLLPPLRPLARSTSLQWSARAASPGSTQFSQPRVHGVRRLVDTAGSVSCRGRSATSCAKCAALTRTVSPGYGSPLSSSSRRDARSISSASVRVTRAPVLLATLPQLIHADLAKHPSPQQLSAALDVDRRNRRAVASCGDIFRQQAHPRLRGLRASHAQVIGTLSKSNNSRNEKSSSADALDCADRP